MKNWQFYGIVCAIIFVGWLNIQPGLARLPITMLITILGIASIQGWYEQKDSDKS